MRATKVEQDTLVMAKHDLEASLQKEQEECHVLRGELQGRKEQQGILGNELEAMKKDLARHTSLAQEREGRSRASRRLMMMCLCN